MDDIVQDDDTGTMKPRNTARFQNFILISVSVLFLLALGVKLLLNVSRIEIKADPPMMMPDGRSTTMIEAVPYNTLGLRIPRRKLQVFYVIRMGGEKVDVVSRSSNSITLRAKRETGDVIIEARLPGAVIPYEIVVPILPLYAYQSD